MGACRLPLSPGRGRTAADIYGAMAGAMIKFHAGARLKGLEQYSSTEKACGAMAPILASAETRLKGPVPYMLAEEKVHAAMLPRKPIVHRVAGGPPVKKGRAAAIALNKEKKAWRLAREGAEAAKAARAAAGIEDCEADLEEEAVMAAPEPEGPNRIVSGVKMKLATFCKNQDICRLLDSIVMDCNVMVAEAYAFANLHVTRLLEDAKPVPKLDQSFYNSCLTAVTACGGNTFTSEMKETIKVFDALRPSGEKKINSVKLHDIRSELAIVMETMTSNHLWMNLAQRLSHHLALKYPHVTKALRKVVVQCVVVTPKLSLNKVDKLSLKTERGKELGEGRKRAIIAARELIATLRARCKVTVAGRGNELLPLYFDMMRHVEAAYAASRLEGVDAKRTAKLRKTRFSLLPNKRGFTVSSIPICGRALMGVLVRVKSPEGGFLAKVKGPDSGHDAAWRKHFNVNAVETRERAFRGSITTDGVSVGICMDREQAIVLSKTNSEWDAKRIKREKGPLPVMYGGVDPGYTDVVTVAHSSELRSPNGPDKSIPSKVTSYSSSRYAEESKQKSSNRLTATWNDDTSKEAASLLLDTDRSTSEGLSAFQRSYLAVFRTILQSRAKRGYRNLRFTRYVYKQKAVSSICDLIAPAGKYNVIAYGDWSGGNGSPIKRRWSGPQEDIKRELQRRRNVLYWSMWEYRTSVTCHETWRRLSNMRARTTKYDRDTKTMVLSAKRVSVHKVLHCRSSDGVKGRHGGGTWNRDANASRNMLMLMMLVVLGVERPKEFTPAVPVVRRDKQGTKDASPDAPATSLSITPLSTEG
jgi:hypothetical protein